MAQQQESDRSKESNSSQDGEHDHVCGATMKQESSDDGANDSRESIDCKIQS